MNKHPFLFSFLVSFAAFLGSIAIVSAFLLPPAVAIKTIISTLHVFAICYGPLGAGLYFYGKSHSKKKLSSASETGLLILAGVLFAEAAAGLLTAITWGRFPN